MWQSKEQKKNAIKAKEYLIQNAESWKSRAKIAKECWISLPTLNKIYNKMRVDGEIQEINWQTGETIMTTKVIEELKKWFTVGFNDKQACLTVGIGTSTFYEYCKRHPLQKEIFDILKTSDVMQAKANVYQVLQSKNPLMAKEKATMSKFVLENKASEEYHKKTNVDSTVNDVRETLKIERVESPYANLDENWEEMEEKEEKG